jgi:FkbH-like protein
VKLINALEVLRRSSGTVGPEFKTFLACGFTPLHLQTFLAAHLQMLRPENRITIQTGLFGDLSGNIERLELAGVDALAASVEWADVDPRLAVRTLGGWGPQTLVEIVESAGRNVARLQRALIEASHRVPVVVSMPTVPLPPMFTTRLNQAGFIEVQLQQTIALFAAALAHEPGIRIVNAQLLGEMSPTSERYDVKADLTSGFPYRLPHASTLGSLLAGLIHSPQPKKGLITDLDDTLWAGILGEDGIDGVSWHLDRHTQMHGLYQQFIASLIGAGVLVGVASKNDASLVEQAFGRTDLLLSKKDIFPFEVHWSRKSESVQRILKTWNVKADSVVFIDDSPMEIAEVKAAFPEMECIVFPKDDYKGIWDLLKRLRDLFGKPFLTEDDAIRLRSIRDAGAWRDGVESGGDSAEAFLRAAEAFLAFDSITPNGDPRSFELVNKTNQFNLNGKRFTESEWRSFLSDPMALVLTMSYKDRYGPLGKIAVVMGKTHGRRLHVSCWVMSCRAFSRRIEHQCLKYLFETMGTDEIVFDFESTPRNGPLREFLTELLGGPPVAGSSLSREQFAANVPPLFHQIEGTVNV